MGWLVCSEAFRIAGGDSKSITIAGDGKQVRVVLHANDMATLYFQVLERITKVVVQVYNVFDGMSNSLSLLKLSALLEGI